MDLASVNKKFSRRPNSFGREAYDNKDVKTHSEIDEERAAQLTENLTKFNNLGDRIRGLAGRLDAHTGDEIRWAEDDVIRRYDFSVSFDEKGAGPFLTLAAFYSPNFNSEGKNLRPTDKITYAKRTESLMAVVAHWWPPQAFSTEWGSFEKPYVANGYNDFFRYQGKPITTEWLDLTQIANSRITSKTLALLESSIVEAEIQHAKNAVSRAKDAERFRILDRVSPIIGTMTVTGRWEWDSGAAFGTLDGLDTPLRGATIPIRDIFDDEMRQPITLEPGEHILEDLPVMTIADIVLSLTIANKHELAAKFITPHQNKGYENDFGRLPNVDELYQIGVPAAGGLMDQLDSVVNIFPEPVASGEFYNPKLKGLGLPLLRPLDPEVPFDPSAGMLPLPADKHW